MDGYDKWMAAEDAKRAKGRERVAALFSEAQIHDLVKQLASKMAVHASVAERLAKVEMFSEFRSEASSASACTHVAWDLLNAYESGRPITLKARLQSAHERLAVSDYDVKTHKATLRKLERKEAAAAKKKAA